jgi:large conductance mechanosensitive channel
MQVLNSQLSGYGNFLMEHNVVQLGIAFVIGIQVNTIATSLVTDIFTPLILLLFGEDNVHSMADLYIEVYQVRITYGRFLIALINFLFLIFIIYNVLGLMASYSLIPKDSKV